LLGFHDVRDGHGHVQRDLREVFEARGGLLLGDIELAFEISPSPEHLREGDESIAQEQHENEEAGGVADDDDGQENSIAAGVHHTLADQHTEEDEEEHQASETLEGNCLERGKDL
jgi:hypothetical protein